MTRERHEVAVFAPALMLLVELHEAHGGAAEVHLHAGGQGYWVARMVQALGADPIPCVSVGGEPGEALRAIIAADGLDAWYTPTAAPNAVIVDDRRPDGVGVITQTPIPTLNRHEADEIYSGIIGASLRAGVCVVAGTQLAPILPADTFGRLVSDLRRNGVQVIVDVCGEPLRAALESGIDVVKLSHEELLDDGWASDADTASIAAGIRKVQRAGAHRVVVSRKSRPTIAGDDGRLVEVRSPTLEVLDGRGGGDSMTAALAVAAARALPFDDGLRLAAAAASLNVSRHGLGTGRRDSIEEIAEHVAIRDLDAAGKPRSTKTARDLDGLTRTELYELAKAIDVPGRSTMTRAELIATLAT